jgi:carbon monoxide dehydrogenase subunit G
MDLNNDFRVGVPVSQAWSVLSDVERIAPHLPGAQLQEIEGDEYRGIVKVKVGPITAQYKGTAVFLEKDEAAGKMVLRCTGRDTRGQGNANATITVLMKPDGDGTRVTVSTDLTVTGKVAQFGRGVLADVSAKLVGQFVAALEADLRDNGASAPVPAEVSAGSAEADPTSASAASDLSSAPAVAEASSGAAAAESSSTNGSAPVQPAAVGAPGATQSVGGTASLPSAGVDAPTAEMPATAPSAPAGPRKINQPEPAPVDLFDAAGGSVAKRFLPVVGVVGVVVTVFLLRRRMAKRR